MPLIEVNKNTEKVECGQTVNEGDIVYALPYNILADDIYDSEHPLDHWTQPVTDIVGSTATVMFSDNILVFFTYGINGWYVNFAYPGN